MIKRISENLAEELCNTCNKSADDKSVYSYGVYLLILWGATFFTTLGFGILMATMEEIVLFQVFYMPLRKLSGGYHVNTPNMCFLLSVIMVIIAGLMVKYTDLGWSGCGISSILFLTCLPYIPSLRKKSFSNHERGRLRICASCLVLVYDVIIICSLLLEMVVVANACILSIIITEVMIIVNEIGKRR